MEIFVCPRDRTFATNRFTPEYLLSLQNPETDVTALRPEWISAANHQVFYLYDLQAPEWAPSRQVVQSIVDWLIVRCSPGSEDKIIIHCDAGLGRSPAIGYVAWSIYLGPGREQEAFERMKESCLNSQIIPNAVIVAHADDILGRKGALKKPLADWNKKVPWRRTF